MAITAYNHGLSGARRAMRRHGDTAYVDILRNYNGRTFGFASRNFYVAFLAAMQIDQDPQKYFPGVVPEKPTDYSNFQLTSFVAADELASALKVSERDIARHNPALQATIWQGSKYLPKNYAVRLPTNMLGAPLSDLIAGMPEDALYAKQLPDLFHTVARGDTLSEIADTYETRVSTLVALNALGSRHRIRIGQQIRLPAAGPAPIAVASAPVATATQPPPPPPPPAEIIADAPAIAVIEMPEEESPGALADQVSDFIAGLQAALLSDPSDYSVGDDLTIEVHPLETLGHYADWLGLKTQRLRDINGLAFRTPVVVGQRIKLDFGIVNTESFENLRADFHRQQQDTFFRNHTITGVTEHVVRRGESIWILSLRKYDVPVWLFRQYNPELDLDSVQPGTRLNFPILVRNSSD
jgi:membrane-bound lytic murein transglycosylase D